jgi:putative peptidoglycan lipid II flippase
MAARESLSAFDRGRQTIVSTTAVSDVVEAPSTPRNIGSAAFLLAAFMLLQKILALLQQVLIGRETGLSANTDAFFLVQTVALLTGAWIMVSLTTTLIPILRSGDPRRTTGLILNIVGVLVLSSMALFVLAGKVIGLMGPGLPLSTAETAVRLLREMAVLIFLLGATGILNAFYYSAGRFLVPSVAGCLLYVGAIAGVLLEPWMGVDSFAWGMVAGGILQVSLLGWFVGPQHFGRPTFGWRPLASFGQSVLNVLIVSGISTLALMVDRAFASSGRAGTITGVTIASNLMTIPSAMIVTSLSSALLPALVLLRDDRKAFAAMFRHALLYMIFFLGPCNLILLLGSEPLIRLMFHSAQFDANSVHVTSGLLAAYSLGILGIAFKDVFSNALIALGREWIAMASGVVSLTVSIVLKVFYLNPNNPTWIATSTSIAMWVSAGLLLTAVSALSPVGWLRFWEDRGWRLLLANVLLAGWFVALRPYIQSSSMILPLAVLSGGAVMYLAVARILDLNIIKLRVPGAADASRPIGA